MPVAPVFVSTMTELQKRLRLQNITSTDSAYPILEDAMRRVRLGFNRELGISRVNTILATSEVETPTTEEQNLRLLASVTEVLWVRLELMKTLPQAWMDASGDINKRWNEEAPFRERSSEEWEAERQRLETEIQENLDLLDGDDDTDIGANVYDGTPDTQTPRLNDSLGLFPSNLTNQSDV